MRNILFVLVLTATALCYAPAHAADDCCGDGKVPKGTYPNCDPCAGAGAQKNVKELLESFTQNLDAVVKAKAFEYLENCLPNWGAAFGLSFQPPDFCQIIRQYSQEKFDELTRDINKTFAKSADFKVPNTSQSARGAVSGSILQRQ